jgi:phosphatidate cytidylyltransferase
LQPISEKGLLMILKRILTAAVGIPVVVFIVAYCGPAVFFLFILALLLAGLREFFKIALPVASRATVGIGLALGAAVLAGAYHDAGGAVLARESMLPAACALSFAVLFWYHMSSRSAPLRDSAMIVMAQFCGIMYVAFLGSYFVLLRGRPDGVQLIFLLVLVAWAGDTGAFAFGTFMGRHRLSKRISPKKTIEGALGGLVCGVLTAVVFKLFFLQSLSMWHCLTIGVGLNVMNQFGDLCESFIKRACEVKDSGTLFPGHGGVLDRIDSLLFAAPFLYYYMGRALPV